MGHLALLILLQVLWASTYVSMKYAMGLMPLAMVLVLRYGIGAVALAVASRVWELRLSRRDLGMVMLVGLLNFSLSPWLQLTSLTMTRATDVAVIVAMEPLVTAMMAAMVLRERIGFHTLGTFLIATLGVIIMSDVPRIELSLFSPGRMLGNFLFFGAVLCEVLYSLTSRRLTQRHDPLRLAAVMMLAGAVGNIAAMWSVLTPGQIRAVPVAGWAVVAYMGLACSAFAYAAWTWLVKRIPVTRVALSLFLQPVFGALLGVVLLGEQLSVRYIWGAAVVLCSLLLWLGNRYRAPGNH